MLIWLLVVVAEMLRHQYLIKKRRKSPNKVLSWTGRAIIAGLLIWFFEQTRPLEVTFLAYTITGWWIHDYVPNILFNKRPVWYLNKTGFLDRFQNNVMGPDIWFIFKSMLFVFMQPIYFLLT